jgi:hypothetical protein
MRRGAVQEVMSTGAAAERKRPGRLRTNTSHARARRAHFSHAPALQQLYEMERVAEPRTAARAARGPECSEGTPAACLHRAGAGSARGNCGGRPRT